MENLEDFEDEINPTPQSSQKKKMTLPKSVGKGSSPVNIKGGNGNPTPSKSSGEDVSVDMSEEEASQLLTISERTYEESCTALNQSHLS